MLVVLHTVVSCSPPVSEKMIVCYTCSNIATNIVESLPGIWGNGRGGGEGRVAEVMASL